MLSGTRPIDVFLYSSGARAAPRPLAVILPGWGLSPTSYGVFADALVQDGYLVATLGIAVRDDDPPFLNKGDSIAEGRRPLWEIGIGALDAVRAELGLRGLADLARPMVLLGHSHGGDIAVTYAERHPDRIRAVLALDNQRARVPQGTGVLFCLLRSGDLASPKGFLPPANSPGVLVVSSDIPHADMRDTANAAGRATMIAFLNRCIAAHPTDD